MEIPNDIVGDEISSRDPHDTPLSPNLLND
jgi:hypothetical protein